MLTGKEGDTMLVRKEIPRFRNEDEEREFWASHDSADYVDWSRARRVVLPKLKPSTRTISIRLPESMIDELKLLANKRDVPYQSLMKMFLVERIEQELRSSSLARDHDSPVLIVR
jgi:predicted DNA binding CopG/RHH family protein